MAKDMKDVEQVHKEWKDYKKYPLMIIGRLTFAAEHLDMVIYQYYEQKEYIALLEKQVEDPTFLRNVDAYRPKDERERRAFITLWCDKCKKLKDACSGFVELVAITKDGQAVEYDELICLSDGQPTCTAFEVEEEVGEDQ